MNIGPTIIKFFRIKRIRIVRIRKGSRVEYLKYKEEARRLVNERLEFFNKIYGLPLNRITIRNTKSRWGSCSKKGNLNFNYKIALLPPALADYLVVHELCHIKEFNHSQKFWDLVALALPNYKKLRKELKVVK
jgi:predicted metal-dependent hydrolase